MIVAPSDQGGGLVTGCDPPPTGRPVDGPSHLDLDRVSGYPTPDRERRALHLSVLGLQMSADLVEGISDERGKVGLFDTRADAQHVDGVHRSGGHVAPRVRDAVPLRRA